MEVLGQAAANMECTNGTQMASLGFSAPGLFVSLQLWEAVSPTIEHELLTVVSGQVVWHYLSPVLLTKAQLFQIPLGLR